MNASASACSTKGYWTNFMCCAAEVACAALSRLVPWFVSTSVHRLLWVHCTCQASGIKQKIAFIVLATMSNKSTGPASSTGSKQWLLYAAMQQTVVWGGLPVSHMQTTMTAVKHDVLPRIPN